MPPGGAVLAVCRAGCRVGLAAVGLAEMEVRLLDLYHDPAVGGLLDVPGLFRRLGAAPDVAVACSADAFEFICQGLPDRAMEVRVRPELFRGPPAPHLARLHVRGQMDPGAPPHERVWKLKGMVDFRGHFQCKAAAALVQLLLEPAHAGLVRTLESSTSAPLLEVADFRHWQAPGLLRLDQGAVRGLSLFTEENHPSVMGLGGKKEGHSIFRMFEARCTTSLGKRLLRQWMLAPLAAPHSTQGRHAAIKVLLGTSQVAGGRLYRGLAPDELESLGALLGSVRNHSEVLGRLQSYQCNGEPCVAELQALAHSIQACCLVHDFFAGRVSDAGLPLEAGAAGPSRADSGSDYPLPVFEGVLRACGSPDLAVMFNLITRTLDFTQLQGEPPTCVAYGVSPALDELKMAYAGLPELLTATVEREMQRVPSCLARGHGCRVLAIEYLPGCGYLVKTSELLPADLQEVWSDFKSVFQETCEGRTVFYYRSNATEGLNESYGDLLFRIRDQEDAILQELVQSLLEGRDELLVPASEATAPLDVLRAFAVVARDNAFCCPELNWDPGAPLTIRNGRHPLAEQAMRDSAVGGFIPNDTHFGADERRVHVVTGPNLSGKTVYCKQVGLCVYLAHLGSWVPASSCAVPVRDGIFSRIYTPNSSSTPESTFMTDILQVTQLVLNSTPASLVLLDEWGKGTLVADGVGLFCGVIQELSERAIPPLVVSTTHFTEALGAEGFLASGHMLSFFQTTVRVPPSAGRAPAGRPGGLAFLYKLRAGVSQESFALEVASRAGVGEGICRRARQLLDIFRGSESEAGGASLRPAPEVQAYESDVLGTLRRLASGADGSNNPLQYVLGHRGGPEVAAAQA